VGIQDFFSQRQGFAGDFPGRFHAVGETVVDGANHIEIEHGSVFDAFGGGEDTGERSFEP
jgi:hypothetical protein